MLIFAAISLVGSLLGCGETPNNAALQELSCSQGNVNDCYKVGLAQLKPPSGRPNISAARATFSNGCTVRHPDSCNMLGDMVRDARGGPADPLRAAELYAIACTEGDHKAACLSMAKLKYSEPLAKLDQPASVAIFQEACDRDPATAEGCMWLGDAYENGLGVEKKDWDLADTYYKRGCDLNNAESCRRVAVLYATRNKRDDLHVAADFYGRACKINAVYGCLELGLLHRDKKIPDADNVKAGALFQKACNLEPPRGCYEVAMMMDDGRLPAREGEKQALFAVGCEAGHRESCAKR